MKNAFRLFNFNGFPVYIKYWFLFLLLLGTNTFISLFIAVVVHEIAHAIVGQRLGYKVRKVFLDMLYCGAEIEIDFNNENKDTILISLAGPISNLLLFIIGFVILNSGVVTNYYLLDFLATFNYINFVLFVFNILPIYPMDGGRITRGILSEILGNKRGRYYSGIVSLVSSLLLLLLCIKMNLIIIGVLSLIFMYISYKEIK